MATNMNNEVPFTVVTPITPDADRARWRNEAADRLITPTTEAGLSLRDYPLIADMDRDAKGIHICAIERQASKATVERIRAEFSLRRDEQHTDQHEIDYDRYCMNCPDEGTVLNAILDAEAAR